MFVLVEYNNFLEENIKRCKEFNIIPVIMFKIKLNNKNQIKQDLQTLQNLYYKIKPEYSAVQITLDKIENSTIGTVNNLKNYFDIVIGLGGLNKVNRFFLESCQIDFLQDPHHSYFLKKQDFIHHFNSGMNHILFRFAKEKNTSIISSLNFFKSKKYIIPKEIGRINQNLKFANKYNVSSYINYVVTHPSQIKDLIQIKSILGFFDISEMQKKESFKILEKKISKNRLKKSDKYINDDIELI